MIVQEVYDKVTLSADCHQADFLTHFDTSVRAILAKYGSKYVLLPESQYTRPSGIYDTVPVYEEYMNAIVDNILFLLTGNPDRKTDYVAEADDAYKTVWHEKMRGKRFVDGKYKHFI